MRHLCGASLIVLLAAMWVPAQSPGNQRDLWIRGIREPLLGPDGSGFFERTLKDALIPGGAYGISAFRGTVISSRPENAPTELIVAVVDETTPELKLRLMGPYGRPLPKGTIILFNGTPTWFTLNPFQITMEIIEREHFAVVRFGEL